MKKLPIKEKTKYLATIKSYTDISQSRKLAEILPLESADMFYSDMLVDGKHQYNYHYLGTHGFKTFEDAKLTESKRLKFIPCWSLAALLGVLDFPSLTQNKEDEWEVCIIDEDNDGYIEMIASKPIDACYELILKLHELNLL